MAVVTSAMITIIVKSAGLITPRSRPTFSTTSSIRPRVFIRIPSCAAKRPGIPIRRAARNVPPNLPADRQRDDEQTDAPVLPRRDEPDLGAQPGEREEGRQEEDGDDRRALDAQLVRDRAVGRQDRAEQERAEDRVDADLLGDQGRDQQARERPGDGLVRRLRDRRGSGAARAIGRDDEEHDAR